MQWYMYGFCQHIRNLAQKPDIYILLHLHQPCQTYIVASAPTVPDLFFSGGNSDYYWIIKNIERTGNIRVIHSAHCTVKKIFEPLDLLSLGPVSPPDLEFSLEFSWKLQVWARCPLNKMFWRLSVVQAPSCDETWSSLKKKSKNIWFVDLWYR